MILTVLGSGGSTGVPSLFCSCVVCENARNNPDSQDYRRCTCYLLDDDTLIDLGPDFREQVRLNAVDLKKVRQLLLTHSHGDHLDMNSIGRRLAPKFSEDPPPLDFYADDAGSKCIGGSDLDRFPLYNITPCPIHPGEKRISADGSLEIFALRATHDPATTPLNYILRRNGRTLLIANDTGWWHDDTWQTAERAGYCCDAAVIDCYGGIADPDTTAAHLGLNSMKRFYDELVSRKILKDHAPAFGTHFDHHSGCIHRNLTAAMTPYGFTPLYDGMKITI